MPVEDVAGTDDDAVVVVVAVASLGVLVASDVLWASVVSVVEEVGVKATTGVTSGVTETPPEKI